MRPFTPVDPPPPSAGGVFVYLLACSDGTFYVGSASDVFRRIVLHQTGRGAKFTRDHAAPVLVYWEGPFDLQEAVRREFQLKRWSRAKKLAPIEGDMGRLHSLAQRRSHRPHPNGSSEEAIGRQIEGVHLRTLDQQGRLAATVFAGVPVSADGID